LAKKQTQAKAEKVKGKRKWWYNLGVAVLICAFLLFMDYATFGSVTWSLWPVAAMILFSLGFSALELMKGKQRPLWYDILMTIILGAFILVVDFVTTGTLTWAKWPAVAILVFGIGFALLERLGRN